MLLDYFVSILTLEMQNEMGSSHLPLYVVCENTHSSGVALNSFALDKLETMRELYFLIWNSSIPIFKCFVIPIQKRSSTLDTLMWPNDDLMWCCFASKKVENPSTYGLPPIYVHSVFDLKRQNFRFDCVSSFIYRRIIVYRICLFFFFVYQ